MQNLDEMYENISSRWTNNVDDENLARINEYLYFIDN